MSVIITPAEQLEFHRPFTRISKESLIVKNPGEQPIAFKVKTTAPKQYCVRPNAGRIEANSEIEVQIILQPFKEELPDDFKCKDKFLVQTAAILPAFENLDISSMWTQIETTEKSLMHQHKIKCVFLPPTENNNNAVKDDQVAPIPNTAATAEPIASSSTPAVTSIKQAQENSPIALINEPSQPNNAPIVPPPPTTTSLSEEKPITTATATTTSPTLTTNSTVTTSTDDASVPVTAAPVTKTTPASPPVAIAREVKNDINNNDHKSNSTNDKEEELKAALEKIASLEKQLFEIRKEEGLRARNQTGTSNRKLAPTVQPLDAVHQHLAALEKPRPTEGYPPQVVFGVALLVFIITYLFF